MRKKTLFSKPGSCVYDHGQKRINIRVATKHNYNVLSAYKK